MHADTAVERIAVDEVRARVRSVLRRVGADDDRAAVQTDHLIEAELRGHPSHGLRRVGVLRDRIAAGLIQPNATPRSEWSARASLRVDGGHGLGPIAAYAAIDELTARVEETGVAVAALRRTHHIGMLAPYVELLADRGCVGIVMCSTEALVHPWGGSGALVGTNPIAISVPAPGGAVVLDMSTSQVSAGKILDHHERGVALPDGWAVDAAGRPTRDAAAAVAGAIAPFGGSKGYALGVTLGALVGLLSDTAYGPDVRGTLDTSHDTSKGDVIVALSVDALSSGGSSGQLGAYLDRLRESGVDGAPVMVPGDRARASRTRRLEEGIDVTERLWAELGAYSEASANGARA